MNPLQEPLTALAQGDRDSIYHYGDAIEVEVELVARASKVFVGHFYVQPDARGHDLGPTVLAAIIDAGQARGCGVMELHIQPTFTADELDHEDTPDVDPSEGLLDEFGFDYQPGQLANADIDSILVGTRTL